MNDNDNDSAFTRFLIKLVLFMFGVVALSQFLVYILTPPN